jgi:hypothetical protein
MTKNEKISSTLKIRFANQAHHSKGISRRSHTELEKQNLSKKTKDFYDKKGRVSDNHKKARNKANVYAYRARQRNAIPENSDLNLIRKIYENCPVGYHVDHIVALAIGGQHHQDNLQYLPISENCRKGIKSSYNESLVIKWQDLI